MLESATGFSKAQKKQMNKQAADSPKVQKGLVGVIVDESNISTVGKAARLLALPQNIRLP